MAGWEGFEDLRKNVQRSDRRTNEERLAEGTIKLILTSFGLADQEIRLRAYQKRVSGKGRLTWPAFYGLFPDCPFRVESRHYCGAEKDTPRTLGELLHGFRRAPFVAEFESRLASWEEDQVDGGLFYGLVIPWVGFQRGAILRTGESLAGELTTQLVFRYGRKRDERLILEPFGDLLKRLTKRRLWTPEVERREDDDE